MEAVHIKNMILAALAAAGAFITNQLGGWDDGMKVLIALMAADFVTGIMIAAIWKKSPKSPNGVLDSRESFKGLMKKCAVLLMVWIGVMLDRALGESYIRMVIILFFIGNEGLSLLENLGLMGVPYPAFLQRMLEALKEKGDKGETEAEAE